MSVEHCAKLRRSGSPAPSASALCWTAPPQPLSVQPLPLNKCAPDSCANQAPARPRRNAPWVRPSRSTVLIVEGGIAAAKPRPGGAAPAATRGLHCRRRATPEKGQRLVGRAQRPAVVNRFSLVALSVQHWVERRGSVTQCLVRSNPLFDSSVFKRLYGLQPACSCLRALEHSVAPRATLVIRPLRSKKRVSGTPSACHAFV